MALRDLYSSTTKRTKLRTRCRRPLNDSSDSTSWSITPGVLPSISFSTAISPRSHASLSSYVTHIRSAIHSVGAWGVSEQWVICLIMLPLACFLTEHQMPFLSNKENSSLISTLASSLIDTFILLLNMRSRRDMEDYGYVKNIVLGEVNHERRLTFRFRLHVSHSGSFYHTQNETWIRGSNCSPVTGEG